ncbi:MAG: PD-(D/E)XK nuclease family transposase [Campylobacterales bacterium]
MCAVVKEKYIDPFTDFGFKWLFGNEKHKNILIKFIYDLKAPIVDIKYRNLEKLGLNILSYLNVMRYAKEEAEKEGLEKGLKEGLEKGLEKGKLSEKIEIAKKSIQKRLDSETIAMITDLSVSKIESLRGED